MDTPIRNRERVDAYLGKHHPRLIALGWRCLGDPDTKGSTTPYVVRLGLYNDPVHPEVAVAVTEGMSEDFATAIRKAADDAVQGRRVNLQ